MRDTVLSLRVSDRDLRALQALEACLGIPRSEVLRQALQDLALRHGLWNVSEREALPLLSIVSNSGTMRNQSENKG